MNFDKFNQGIERIIDMLSYDFYIITQNKKLKCRCIDPTSKQPDVNCLLCLGLGNKIKISKARGYQSDDKLAVRSGQSTENIASVVYYTRSKTESNDETIIVDREMSYVVGRAERLKSSGSNIIYKKLYCTPKKNMPKLFLKNFYSIVKK